MKFRENAWYRVGSKTVVDRLQTNDVPSGLKFFQDKKWHKCTGVDEHGVEGFASFESSSNPNKLWNFNKYPFLKLIENKDSALDDLLEATARSKDLTGEDISKMGIPMAKHVTFPLGPGSTELRKQMKKNMGFKLYSEFDKIVYEKGLQTTLDLTLIGDSINSDIDPENEFPDVVQAREEGTKNSKEYSRKFIMEKVLPEIRKRIQSGQRSSSFEIEGELNKDIEEFLKGKGYRIKEQGDCITISW